MKDIFKTCLFTLLMLAITNMGYTQKTQIVKQGKQWKLTVDNRPFFVKGVVGHTFLEKVKLYGGNS
ncbi:MAG TPA: hypothetical protein VK205_10085, partial [Prolixibacteraceae bacterium]|nr:hypothetical protein [Prolixibacteraceae bacterium]